mmetsp:Transcript_13338/g.49901  ORF Transcript_13338/g.49901 Transcript_13338/m.49901 type:complete len:221 (+) Transcript_13338:1563-2225(+)
MPILSTRSAALATLWRTPRPPFRTLAFNATLSPGARRFKPPLFTADPGSNAEFELSPKSLVTRRRSISASATACSNANFSRARVCVSNRRDSSCAERLSALFCKSAVVSVCFGVLCEDDAACDDQVRRAVSSPRSVAKSCSAAETSKRRRAVSARRNDVDVDVSAEAFCVFTFSSSFCSTDKDAFSKTSASADSSATRFSIPRASSFRFAASAFASKSAS